MSSKVAYAIYVLLLSCLASSQVYAQTMTIIVRPQVEVSGNDIRLSELIAGNDQVPAQWLERTVGASPDPGRTRTVSLAEIASALQRYPDMNSVTLRGATKITVRRGAYIADPAIVRSSVENYIRANPAWSDNEFTVETPDIPPSTKASPSNIAITVTGFEYDSSSGNYLFRLEIARAGDTMVRQSVPVRVSLRRKTWVATETLKQGAIISDSSVSSEWVASNLQEQNTISANESIAGYETRRCILAGETIQRAAVCQPICTDRGSGVEVIARRGDIEISMHARAMSRGRRGDRVACINDSSKKQVTVELTAPGRGLLLGM